MSYKPQKMVWDSCLDDSPASTPVRIKSITNKKYQNNLEIVKKIIAKNNHRYIEERKKVAALIIKDSNIESAFEDVLCYIDSIDAPTNIDYSEVVLKTALRGSMKRIPATSTYAKEVYLSSIKKAKSIKFHNIVFNFHKCLDKLAESYACDTFFTNKMLSYSFMVLMFLRSVMNLCTIDLSETEAVLISCIYSFNAPTSIDQIYLRLKNSNLLKKYKLFQKSDLVEHLEKLTELKIITFDGVVYKLVEEVFI